MPKPKPWPRIADEIRMDITALALDIDVLTIRLHAALVQEDYEQVAEINLKLNHKGKRIKELAQEAKRL